MNRRRKYLLYEVQGGLCFWCKRKVILNHEVGYREGNSLTNLAATIDHLYSKIHPLRNSGKQVLVMACNECNADRNRAEVRDAGHVKKTVYLPRLWKNDEDNSNSTFG